MDSIEALRSHFRAILDELRSDPGAVKLALELELNWDRLAGAQQRFPSGPIPTDAYADPWEIPFHDLYAALDWMMS